MEFSDYFPIWDTMEPRQQEAVSAGLISRTVKKGTMLHGAARTVQACCW